MLPNVYFIADAAVFDDEFYIEHGHRYDRRNTVLGEKVLDGGEELNIPFGSFFSRYLINHIELAFPFFDNVRPNESLLPLLVRERFFLALRLLFRHVLRIVDSPAQCYGCPLACLTGLDIPNF